MQLIKMESARVPKRDFTVTNFKIKDKKILIKYELPPESTEDRKVDFECQEEPAPELYKSLNALLPDVIAICGLDADSWESGKITGVVFKEFEDTTFVIISASCEIDERCVNISTPLVSPVGKLDTRLDNLIAEIEDYIAGRRAKQPVQQTLDLKTKDPQS